jgi:hypothetical protein
VKDQAIVRIQAPGGPAIRIISVRLIDATTRDTVEFTVLDDYSVYLDLAAVVPGEHRLAMNIAGYPTLHFSMQIDGEAERSLRFISPTPACATITTQQASAGPAASRRVHMVTFALPSKFEAVILVAGADLKGETNYRRFAETWRDDLYRGRTDLGKTPNQPVSRGIHNHTLVSIFDFRTGRLEEQIKGTRGWHPMRGAMQGTQPPAIEAPEAPDALARRQNTDSISIVHVYHYISDLGRAHGGCLRQLHFFSHAFVQGPILLNTSDNEPSDRRDPTDKDPRPKDFLPVNLAAYRDLPAAFTSATHVKNWGCFGVQKAKLLRAVARTKTLDQPVEFDGDIYTSAEVIDYLRAHVFPRSYMSALCRDLGVNSWSAAPGTSSSLKSSSRRMYFYVKEGTHGAVIGWYERNFGCKRDLGGAISFQTLV